MLFLRSTVSLMAGSFSRISVSQSRKMSQLPQKMKAVGIYKHLDISNPESLQDVEVNVPKITNTEVLVEVKAIGMNPIDTKVRSAGPDKPEYSTPRILGWDGAGKVVHKGYDVQEISVGDEVMFIGDISKNGSNSQFVALEKVLVAQKPRNISFEEAAAMPLTSVTAYEALYDRLGLSVKDEGKSLLIINSAGGVGSVASQLAKNLGLNVIGTASRAETEAFSKKYGADIVLNHTQNLLTQLEEIGLKEVDYVLLNYDPAPYWDIAMKAVKPQGKICLLVDTSKPVDLKIMKDKSITVVYEMMNTRIKYNTPDKERLHEILVEISKLLEKGVLQTTLSKTMSPVNSNNLKEAHKIMENQKMIGKLVLTGF